MTEPVPWFARAWRRPSTSRRMAVGAVAYLTAAACFSVLALVRDGLGAWLTLAVAGVLLWLGGTLAATVVWRRSNSTPT